MDISPQIAEWLRKIPKISNVRRVKVTLTKSSRTTLVYYGCEYEERDCSCIYLVGEKPSFRRKSCFRHGDKEWYIAGWVASEGVAKHKEFHPFGVNFLVMPWTSSEPIDKYERTKYTRVPMSVEYLELRNDP